MVEFIRFVCADPHPVADAELGMFAARDAIDFTQLKVWEDRLQVLALPEGPIPKAFVVPKT